MQQSIERNRARTWVSWLSTTKAMRVATKRTMTELPPRCGKESDRSERGDMSNSRRGGDKGDVLVRSRRHKCDSRDTKLALYGHAQGVTPIQQASPFKGKTCPIPIDSSTPPCHHHSTTASDSTFPRSKYESPVFRQNNVRRLQRSSKERSRLHSMRKESSSQAGQ